MALFSTFVFIVHCRKTQFQLSFFRYHSVEIVSKYVSKSTPLFGSVRTDGETPHASASGPDSYTRRLSSAPALCNGVLGF
jgi:hypothetical protein